MTLDKNDDVYIVGEADFDMMGGRSSFRGGFPTKNAYQTTIPRTASSCGFVSKFTSSGQLEYSTYLGGKYEENLVQDIVTDNEGNAYVSGMTGGGFPTRNGYKIDTDTEEHYYTGFVAKLSANGNKLLASTYIGGDNDYVPNSYIIYPSKIYDAIFFNALLSLMNTENLMGVCKTIALDKNGDIYVSGETISKKYPVTDNAYQSRKSGESDCVITNLNGCLNELLYSSYIGGAKKDVSNEIRVNDSGEAVIAGETKSSKFPLTEEGSINKEGSAFALKLKIENAPTPEVNDYPIENEEEFILTTGPIAGYSYKKKL